MRKAFAMTPIAAFLALCVVIFTSAALTPYNPGTSSVLISANDSRGSGVHIGRGLFITAAHVVDGAEKIAVAEHKSELLWKNDAYDVALVYAPTASDTPIAAMNCAAPELSPGEQVETVGNPLGLRNIHAWGRVSRITEPGPDENQRTFIADMTAAPGNSGGPVYNMRGELVGIIIAVSTVGASLVPLTYIVPTSSICRLLGRA